jgi:hypothetical protein
LAGRLRPRSAPTEGLSVPRADCAEAVICGQRSDARPPGALARTPRAGPAMPHAAGSAARPARHRRGWYGLAVRLRTPPVRPPARRGPGAGGMVWPCAYGVGSLFVRSHGMGRGLHRPVCSFGRRGEGLGHFAGEGQNWTERLKAASSDGGRRLLTLGQPCFSPHASHDALVGFHILIVQVDLVFRRD